MELIKKAKEYLILYNPFFAYLALQIEFIEDRTVGTTSIDGIQFRYNEEWLSDIDVRTCAGLIAHGMAHVLLLHPLRAEGKSIRRWNAACDYAVNSILRKSNITLVNDLYDVKFEGKDTETIYEILKDEGNDEQGDDSPMEAGSGSDDSGFAGFDDGSDFVSEDGSDICKVALPDTTTTQEKELESIITQKIIDAATQSGADGGDGVSDVIKTIVDELKEPKKDWRELLHKFTAEIARNDYDWQQPDQSYMQRGLYIPGLHNEEIGGVIFAIDTSASINDKLLVEFLSELREAVSQMTEDVIVIHCDTEVRKVEEVQAEEIENIVPEGRGGTKFAPVFEYIEANDLHPKALIYFTDGRCYEKLVEPDYPVIWCIYENTHFTPQFGESITVDNY